MTKLTIDLVNETPMGLAAVARSLPPLRGRPVSPNSVWRWVVDGVLLPDGSRLRMPAIKVGNTWTTTKEAFNRFVEATTRAALPELPDTVACTYAPTRQTAARELDRIGI